MATADTLNAIVQDRWRREREELKQGDSSLTFALQALLLRHESFVSNSETERKRMQNRMDDLESEKLVLEDENKASIAENRKLLDQLETLNIAVAESEKYTNDLEETLRSTEQELQRLNSLAAHAENLQRQLERLETEQEALHALNVKTKEDERVANMRSQQAERTVLNLNLQIEQIERGAKEERDRHDEVLNRIDRRRAMEGKHTLSVDGVARDSLHETKGNSVISHFVKDILQDNANLQLGIIELRELLRQSHDEVETLRGHREVDRSPERTPKARKSPRLTLGAELGTKEVHVHHHYHAPSPTQERVPRPLVHRRPRRKRTQTSLPSSPNTQRSSSSPFRPASPSSASAVLSQTTVCIPQQRAAIKRWSIQSSQTASSVPSSPYSDSIFDRGFSELATDLSRPTSPEGSLVLSPSRPSVTAFFDECTNLAHKRKGSMPRFAPEDKTALPGVPSNPARSGKRSISALNGLNVRIPAQITIPEETEDYPTSDTEALVKKSPSLTNTNDLPSSPQTPLSPISMAPLRARRGSVVSISGMDIHTLAARPSQLFIGSRNFSAPAVPLTAMSNNIVLSQQSVTAARPVITRGETSALAASRNVLAELSSDKLATGTRSLRKKESIGLLESGRRMGGWMFGKWGSTTTPQPAPPKLTPSPGRQEAMTTVVPAELTINTAGSSDVPHDKDIVPDGSNYSRLRPLEFGDIDNTCDSSLAQTQAPSNSDPQSLRLPESQPEQVTPTSILAKPISEPHSTVDLTLKPATQTKPTPQTQGSPSNPPLKPKSSITTTPVPAQSNILSLTRKQSFRPRPPGINQMGPIFGFGPEPPAPFKVHVEEGEVDVEELRGLLGS